MTQKPKTQLPKERNKRVGSLKTRGNILSEMGKVYREVRRGECTAIEGKNVASMLQGMAQVIKDGDAEEVMKQIAALRDRLEGKVKPDEQEGADIIVLSPPHPRLVGR
jgi:hypothetical protein